MAATDFLRHQLSTKLLSPFALEPRASSSILSTDWPELDAVLPDRGFPKGVVELSAPCALGGGTSIALSAVRAAQRKDGRAWCAWVDAEGTLYAPGVARAGVELERLLVVRPPRAEARRIAVKVALARAFDVIVVDAPMREPVHRTPSRSLKAEVWVRKLALAAEQGGATILLLTDSSVPRSVPWPVALRLDLGRAHGQWEKSLRDDPSHVVVKVLKDKRGRLSPSGVVPMRSRPKSRDAVVLEWR